MSALTVVGCGAHGRKVARAALAAGFSVRRFLDEDAAAESPVQGMEVSPLADARAADEEGIVVAVGNAAERRRLVRYVRGCGFRLETVVHPRACVAPDAVLEAGVVVLAGAIVEDGAHVGEAAIVDIGAIVDHDAVVLAYGHVRAGCVVQARAVWPPHDGP